MIRALLLLVALLLGVAPPGLAAAAGPPRPEAVLQKEHGDLLKKSGDLAGAEQEYRQAVKTDASYAEAQEALGAVLYAQKRFDEAARAFGGAVAADPARASAWYQLAFAQRRVGDLGQARLAYARYVELRPADPDGHFGLAETLRGLKERELALAEYRRFLELAQADPGQALWVEKARAAIAELEPEASRAPASAPPLLAPTAAPAAPAMGPPPAAAALPPPVPPPAPPAKGLTEKLGAGDRAYLAGDFRTALFAYQDAVYLDPGSAPARIRLARAYVALRYPAQAEAQLKQVLDLDPGNEEARRGLEELKNPPPTPVPTGPPAAAKPAPPPANAPRVYKLTDDAAAIGAAAMVAPRQAPPAATPPADGPAASAATAPAAVPAAPSGAPAPDFASAAQHYRAGLALIASRDYKGAIIELDQSIEANPNLGAAFSARATAWYGLGRYADAARDYEAAIGLAPNLATPIYGLAECYRRLNDPRAAEYYQRYADSSASDVREELRVTARKRAAELGGR